jgi:hypothetical protein
VIHLTVFTYSVNNLTCIFISGTNDPTEIALNIATLAQNCRDVNSTVSEIPSPVTSLISVTVHIILV